MTKRVLSLILALLTILALCAPAFASAEPAPPAEPEATAEPEVPAVPGDRPETAASSGACGPNASWAFDAGTGTLTISGTGKMTDFMEKTGSRPPAHGMT